VYFHAQVELAQNLKRIKARVCGAEKLDHLITLVGELVIANAVTALRAEQTGEQGLMESVATAGRFVEEVRDSALGLRMVQIGETFNRFHRVVRDVSRDLGKDIELVITGGEAELDKTVVEKISDPLMHLVRNALSYVSYKDRRAVAADLKTIYSAATATDAEAALMDFAATWDARYPTISKSWMAHWERIIPFFCFPADIRKAIYTTNAIESLNSVIRKAVNQRKIFAHDNSAYKVVFMAIEQASKKWTMPIRDWHMAMNQFMIIHGERLKNYQ
jgi:transposase-like protein